MTINIFALKGDLNGKIVVVRFFFCWVYINKVHLGTNSKWANKNTEKFHLISAYVKDHISVRKINQIHGL